MALGYVNYTAYIMQMYCTHNIILNLYNPLNPTHKTQNKGDGHSGTEWVGWGGGVGGDGLVICALARVENTSLTRATCLRA
jgi:hypothetical protein